MKTFVNILLTVAILGIIGVIVADRMYVSKFEEKFRKLETYHRKNHS